MISIGSVGIFGFLASEQPSLILGNRAHQHKRRKFMRRDLLWADAVKLQTTLPIHHAK